ncbi:hypothetical protein BD408DRAFT_425570, partial [Parasitella parasitica]
QCSKSLLPGSMSTHFSLVSFNFSYVKSSIYLVSSPATFLLLLNGGPFRELSQFCSMVLAPTPSVSRVPLKLKDP